MPYDQQFGLFHGAAGSPLWRASFADLDEPKRKAQRLADKERQEFFVYRIEDDSEIARSFPTRNKPVEAHPDSTGNIGSATGEAK